MTSKREEGGNSDGSDEYENVNDKVDKAIALKRSGSNSNTAEEKKKDSHEEPGDQASYSWDDTYGVVDKETLGLWERQDEERLRESKTLSPERKLPPIRRMVKLKVKMS